MAEPNLGGKKLNLVAKDDAVHVHAVPVDDVLNGTVAMPFLHIWFAYDYYRQKNDANIRKLENELAYMFYTGNLNSSQTAQAIMRENLIKTKIIPRWKAMFTVARIRNHRLMRKVNAVLEKHAGKMQFNVPEDIDIEKALENATALGCDVTLYMDEAADVDDVEQCTNEWCLNQSETCGKASDNVVIITDLDGVDWFVLIVRQNGPGRNQLAWAGGFVDNNETFKDAAIREMDEEMEIGITGKYTTTHTELPTVKMNDWDPRAKFVAGMEVAARVTHHVFGGA
jgi:hypothetical protein